MGSSRFSSKNGRGFINTVNLPSAGLSEKANAPRRSICNLVSFVGDKGQEIYLTFDWQTVQVGTGDTARNVSEKEILERVPGKYKAHVEAKKNPIMAVVQFD